MTFSAVKWPATAAENLLTGDGVNPKLITTLRRWRGPCTAAFSELTWIAESATLASLASTAVSLSLKELESYVKMGSSFAGGHCNVVIGALLNHGQRLAHGLDGGKCPGYSHVADGVKVHKKLCRRIVLPLAVREHVNEVHSTCHVCVIESVTLQAKWCGAPEAPRVFTSEP